MYDSIIMSDFIIIIIEQHIAKGSGLLALLLCFSKIK
jgi:hypothetical protein